MHGRGGYDRGCAAPCARVEHRDDGRLHDGWHRVTRLGRTLIPSGDKSGQRGPRTGSHRANVAAKRGSIPAPSPFRAATARAAPSCCEPRVVGSCLSLASGVLGKRMHLHDATLSVQHTERQRAAHHGRTEHDVWRQSCRSGYPPEAPEQRARLHCEHDVVSRGRSGNARVPGCRRTHKQPNRLQLSRPRSPVPLR